MRTSSEQRKSKEVKSHSRMLLAQTLQICMLSCVTVHHSVVKEEFEGRRIIAVSKRWAEEKGVRRSKLVLD